MDKENYFKEADLICKSFIRKFAAHPDRLADATWRSQDKQIWAFLTQGDVLISLRYVQKCFDGNFERIYQALKYNYQATEAHFPEYFSENEVCIRIPIEDLLSADRFWENLP